jgi:hypothetical protein
MFDNWRFDDFLGMVAFTGFVNFWVRWPDCLLNSNFLGKEFGKALAVYDNLLIIVVFYKAVLMPGVMFLEIA